jgi:hypothetical protein
MRDAADGARELSSAGAGTVGAYAGDMNVPLPAVVITVVLLAAVGVGFFHSDPVPAGAERPPPPAVAAVPKDTPLPPNHPPIGLGDGPHGASGMMAPAADDAPAISWTAPPGWTPAPNPNAMRIATYHPSADTDVSVARAGGATDANIQRWVGQFDDAGPDKHTERTVRGLVVKMVEVSGTYSGAGMMTNAPSEPHPGWALVGAVVETPGVHYFFKMVGPIDQVRAARASFDVMIASISPS